MALSIGFGNSVSLLPAIQATRLLTFALVGLSPTEHTCFSWSRFRTASFPQYGWKVGLSGSAFPRVTQVKPAPGVPCASRRFASALRALRCPTLHSALCRNSEFGSALPFEELSPLPQRSSLRSGFCCPSPSTLTRPHPSHSQAHSHFAALRFIGDAFAVLVRLGNPRVVPCFHCAFLLDMPPSTTAGSPLAACAQFLRQRCWPSPELERFGTPEFPHHPLPMGRIFAASPVRYSLRPVELLASLADPTGYLAQPSEAFTPGLSTSWSPFSPPGITTVATEQAPPAGLSPAGTSVSIAAPSPCLDDLQFPEGLRHAENPDRKTPADSEIFAKGYHKHRSEPQPPPR